MIDTIYIKIQALYRKRLKNHPSRKVMVAFALLLMIVGTRLFYLQIVQWWYYEQILIDQHFSKSSLKAERGNIFVKDRSDKAMQLSQNMNLYNLFVDPNFLPDKERFIQDFTPLLYQHFCEQFAMQVPTVYECIDNIQQFIGQELLPQKQEFFYQGDPATEEEAQALYQWQYEVIQEYDQKVQEIMQSFTKDQWYALIATALDEKIYVGNRRRNYLGSFANQTFIDALKNLDLPYISREWRNTIYIIPTAVVDERQAKSLLSKLNEEHNAWLTSFQIQRAFQTQRVNYIRLITNMHGKIAAGVKQFKSDNSKNRIWWIPLYHWVWLEETTTRYYPYGWFMAHVLGYVTNEWNGLYGIEEYFNDRLAGKDGKILWLASPFLGQVWSNAVEVEEAIPGDDIYLTIDPIIQKEIERMAYNARHSMASDWVAVTVMDPYTAKVVAMVSMPDFDPNRPQDSYKLEPITSEYRYLLEQDSFLDRPVMYFSGWSLQFATPEERNDTSISKYKFQNHFWSIAFLNRNISLPYEPGSIFKPISVAIGIDSSSVWLYDYYDDPWEVMIWDFRIANISRQCKWTNTFSHALAFSCNVGMVRVAQRMTHYIFYNYLERLWFTKNTGIELAWEHSSRVPNIDGRSIAWFFNNTFGHWFLTTPLQLAVTMSAMVNGGLLMQPTIIDAIYNNSQQKFESLPLRVPYQIFSQSTSEIMKQAMVEVVEFGSIDNMSHQWYSLGVKSWTAEIAYKWVYRGQTWRTNGSAVWMITKNHTKYVMVVQVRRPRSSKRWNDTAVKLFDEITWFLLEYDNIPN